MYITCEHRCKIQQILVFCVARLLSVFHLCICIYSMHAGGAGIALQGLITQVYLHPSLLAPMPKCHGEGSHELTPKIAHGLCGMDPQKTLYKNSFSAKTAKINNWEQNRIYFPLTPAQPPFKGGRYSRHCDPSWMQLGSWKV